MNVISGKFRGLILESCKNPDLRPTKDRIKKSIFDILRFKIKDKIFAELFGGTGQIGIEAYSQGAKKVIISEQDFNNSKIIERNISKIKSKHNIKLINSCALELFNNNLDEMEEVDIFFLDPPYEQIELLNKILDLITNMTNLPEIIVIETLKENLDKILFNMPKNLYLQKMYNYGKILVSLYEKV